MNTPNTSIEIRWMIRRDMSEVLSIENTVFENPWSEEEFVMHLRQRNAIGLVAFSESSVVGFVIYELHKSYLQVRNFAVSFSAQGQGVGKALITKLTGKLSEQRRTRIITYVRESNLPAHKFFRAVGFRATRVIRDYFGDTGEDAYQFDYRLAWPSATPPMAHPHNRIAGYIT